MKKFGQLLFCFVPLVILAACGGGGGGAPSTGPGPAPTVVSTSPASSAMGVAASTAISATFSEAMDASTITTSTFIVSDGTNDVAGTVSYDAATKTATFTPASPLAATTAHTPQLFTVTIKGGANGVKEAGGTPMTADASWSFTIWAGTQQFGSLLDEVANGVGTDGGRNIYLAGYTNGSLQAGNSNPDPSGATSDVLVVKYDVNGAKVWTRQTGSAFDDRALGFATYSSGSGTNLYAAGYTDGTLPNSTVSNPDATGATANYFVMKYDSAGNSQWVIQSGSAVDTVARAVAIDASGNIYVAGDTAGNIGGQTNYAGGSTDAFVAKYDANGNLLWTRLLGTTGDDGAYGIAADASGNVYVTGNTTGSFATFTNAGGTDIFVAAFDTNGTSLWVKQFGTAKDDHAGAIALDRAHSALYVAGGTKGGLNGNSNADTTATAGTTNDLFVMKFDTSGSALWTKQFGTAQDDDAHGVATDSAGNVYLTGYTSGSLDGTTTTSNPDIFLVKYDATGARQWTKQLGSTQTDNANAVTVAGDGSVFLAGDTAGNLDGNANMDGTFGSTDYVLVKYDTTGVKY